MHSRYLYRQPSRQDWIHTAPRANFYGSEFSVVWDQCASCLENTERTQRFWESMKLAINTLKTDFLIGWSKTQVAAQERLLYGLYSMLFSLVWTEQGEAKKRKKTLSLQVFPLITCLKYLEAAECSKRFCLFSKHFLTCSGLNQSTDS